MIINILKNVVSGRRGHTATDNTASLISQEYAALNAQLHADNEHYGTSGKRWAPVVANLFKQTASQDILDYGCGKQTLAATLSDFPIRGYDPAITGLDSPPEPADLLVCTDVLEHVEPGCIERVLDDLAQLAEKAAFVTVATRPAVKTLADGRNAHLTVQAFEWWREHFSRRFHINEVKEIEGHEFALVLTPLASPLNLLPVLGTQRTEQPTQVGNEQAVAIFKHKGREIRFNAPNDITKWRISTLLQKEPATIEWLDQLEQGDVLIDVGANVGMYSLYAAIIRDVQVFAFEPESQNYALLNTNIFTNKLSQEKITAFPLAISDKNGASLLHLSAFSTGGSCHSLGDEVGFDLQPRRAAYSQGTYSTTIDELVSLGVVPQPTHLKVDVDGFEHKVVAGALNTLANAKLKSIIIELNTALKEHNDIIETLSGLGFHHDPKQVERVLRKDGAFKGVGEFIFTKQAPKIDQDYAVLRRETRLILPRAPRAQSVLEHIAERVQASKVQTSPYPHAVVDNIFPEEYYADIIRFFPAISHMPPITEQGRIIGKSDAYDQRYAFLFEESALSQLPQEHRNFWLDAADWLYSDRFTNIFLEKFRSALTPRLSSILQEEEAITYKGDALLVNDKTRYAIGPHTDGPQRLITFLFYLPIDDRYKKLGTSLYEPLDESFTCWGGPHHKFDAFRLNKTIEFLPNRLFCFPKTEKSFHGVERIHEENVDRQLLIHNVRLLNKKKY